MVDYQGFSTAQWLTLAQDFYARLGRYMRSLPPSAWTRPTTYLGWDCLQLAAHLTSAITINFQLLVRMAREGTPVPPEGFNIFLRNAQAVRDRQTLTPSQVLDEYDREIAAMMTVYRSLSEEEWRLPAFFFIGDVDIRMLFQVQLSDVVVHERDLHVAQGEEFTFLPDTTGPLLDWFLRAFRPASFRPERAAGLDRTIHYHIVGSVPGDWTMVIRDQRLRVTQGVPGDRDVRVTLSVESLVDMALARAAPWVADIGRLLAHAIPATRREDFTARFTGRAALASALIRRKVILDGDRRVLRELQPVFWHFWERMPQTQENIRRSSLRRA